MTECPDSVSDVIGGQATTLPVGVRLSERHRCFVSFELGHLGVSISAVSRRFLPAFVSSGVAAVFLVVLVVVPRRGARACMESSPVQCRIAEIVHSGLAITGVVLIASVASIFLASRAGLPQLRAVSIVAGFVGLAIVMAFGAELSWALSIELRY